MNFACACLTADVSAARCASCSPISLWCCITSSGGKKLRPQSSGPGRGPRCPGGGPCAARLAAPSTNAKARIEYFMSGSSLRRCRNHRVELHRAGEARETRRPCRLVLSASCIESESRFGCGVDELSFPYFQEWSQAMLRGRRAANDIPYEPSLLGKCISNE